MGKKKDQKKKCENSWFKDVCVVSCCKANSDDSDEEKNKPECKEFTDPHNKQVTKPGTDIVNDCKQKKEKDQRKKCEKDYFRDVCSNIGLPPGISNPEACPTEEPNKVTNPGNKKKNDCKQEKKKDQERKCENSWFRDVCSNTCCNIGLPPGISNPEACPTEEHNKVTNPGNKKKMIVNKRKKKIRRKNVKIAGSKMFVLFLAVKLTLMILTRKKTNPNAKNSLTPPINK